MYFMLQKWDVGQWWDCSAKLPTQGIAEHCAKNMRECGNKIQIVKHATEDVVTVVDERTMAELAKEALEIQSACNLSGLAFGLARAMQRFNELNPKIGGDKRNTHPIFVLWTDKLSSLSGAQYGLNIAESFYACEQLRDSGIDRHLAPPAAAVTKDDEKTASEKTDG